jgi:hypothetical protein
MGNVRNGKTDRNLNGYVSSDGYVTVSVQAETKTKKPFVYRLVAATFLPNPENKRCVDHNQSQQGGQHVRQPALLHTSGKQHEPSQIGKQQVWNKWRVVPIE